MLPFFDQPLRARIVADRAERIGRRVETGVECLNDLLDLGGSEFDYAMFRSLVQYAYPGGGNGSVIVQSGGVNQASMNDRDLADTDGVR